MNRLLFLLLFLLSAAPGFSQDRPFRFAFISDTHIGSPNGGAEEDLRRTVADINRQEGIAFVVLTGDITELGTNRELALAKQLLDSLRIPYFIIPGNHDTGWSESGGLGFSTVFGDDKFYFRHQGVHFIGCASGPYVRMSDGHVPRSHVNWLKARLKKIPKGEPIVFLNHYPLDSGLDNWYEIIDLLKEKGAALALCGHGHNNREVQAEGIPAVMGRSNLRAKATEGGYNLVDLHRDSIFFTERKPVSGSEKLWKKLPFTARAYRQDSSHARPDFSVNQTYSGIRPGWTYQSAANIISTPAVLEGLAVVGNQLGQLEAIDLNTGRRRWTFATGGPIFSSPAAAEGRVVFGSADGSIYCLSRKGKLLWKVQAGAAVLGAPLIVDGIVYIGASDHGFRALSLADGQERWRFDSVAGPITSKPLHTNGKIIFGAWDSYLYALDAASGKKLWKWSNGSSIANYSPAACIPVSSGGNVYVAAPDRYLTAIDEESGVTRWRTNEAAVRESLGLSQDGKWIWGKTMQDTVVAFATGNSRPAAAWKLPVGYGYEHAPSMLIEKDGLVYFGTRSGTVYAIDPRTPQKRWAHKIDNSMVNTVVPLEGGRVLATTMDGKMTLLQPASATAAAK
jgi:outer membrane protein assembly factor BamB/predicted phosphodiesterase